MVISPVTYRKMLSFVLARLNTITHRGATEYDGATGVRASGEGFSTSVSVKPFDDRIVDRQGKVDICKIKHPLGGRTANNLRPKELLSSGGGQKRRSSPPRHLPKSALVIYSIIALFIDNISNYIVNKVFLRGGRGRVLLSARYPRAISSASSPSPSP